MRKLWTDLLALMPGAVVAIWAYWSFGDWLYRGLDGSYYFLLAKELGNPGRNLWGLGLDHLQGCSSLQFPVNFRLSLTFLFAKCLPFAEKEDLYFASVAIVALGSWGIAYRLKLAPSAKTASFLLNILALLPVPFGFYGLAGCCPVFPEISVLSCLCVVLLIGNKEEAGPWAIGTVYGILFYLGVTYPTFLVFLFPVLALVGYMFLKKIWEVLLKKTKVKQKTMTNRLFTIHLCMLPLLSVLAAWILGHLLYSTFGFFKSEIVEKLAPGDISLFFWGPKGFAALILIICSVVFCFLNIFVKPYTDLTIYRISLFLLSLVSVQVVALVLVALGYRISRGFALVYIEYLLYPLSLLIVVCGTKTTIAWCAEKIPKASFDKLLTNGAIGVVGILLISAFFYHLAPFRQSPGPDYFRFPQSNIILKEIIQRGGTVSYPGLFHGRTEVFLGIGNPRKQGCDWSEFHAFQGLCLEVWQNDFRATGLWAYSVPTLFQYSPLRDPFLHYLCKNFLAIPEDSTWKNVPVLTVPSPSILGLLGVKFLISDTPIQHENLSLLQALPFPEEKEDKKEAWWANRSKQNPWKSIDGIRLYEISNINLGERSPRIVKSSFLDGVAVLNIIKAESIFQNDRPVAVVSDRKIGDMINCEKASIWYNKNGIKINAKALGPSCLLLPITFSHCLKIKSNFSKSTIPPRLVRANLAQTLLIFENEFDGEIQYESSPFINPWSIWFDYKDAKVFLSKNKQ